MQLKTQTDYAIRILAHLTKNSHYVSRKDLCTLLGIAENYLPIVTKPMRKKGWISSGYGPNGGYILTGNPQKITLLDVMKVMEDTVRMNRCLEKDMFCSRHAVEYCPVHKVYEVFQGFYEDYFASITIEALLKPDLAAEHAKEVLEQLKAAAVSGNDCGSGELTD